MRFVKQLLSCLALCSVLAPPGAGMASARPAVGRGWDVRTDAGRSAFEKRLRSAILPCTSAVVRLLPPGGPRPVILEISKEGALQSVAIAGARSDDPKARERGDAFLQGLTPCSPFHIDPRFLPSYEAWRRFEVNFVAKSVEEPPGRQDGATPPKTPLSDEVLSGAAEETVPGSTVMNGTLTLGPFSTLAGTCAVKTPARAKLLAQPEFGETRIVMRRGDVAFLPGSNYAHCNGRRIIGTTILYRPRRNFAGQDRFRFQLTFADGEVRRIAVNVTVNRP